MNIPDGETAELIVAALRRAAQADGSHRKGHPLRCESQAERFFSEWYRPQHGPRDEVYLFLFRRNLASTNLPLAELVSLVRMHTHRVGTTTPATIQIVSVTQFSEMVRAALPTYVGPAGPPPEERDAGYRAFAQAFASVMDHLVVFDPLWTSCNVLLPPTMHLDLESVVASAGYIHRAGRLVFCRNTKKCDVNYLSGWFDRYLRPPDEQGRKQFCAVLSHEDFPEEDPLCPSLSDVKIWMDKYHVGTQPLVEVLRELRDRYADRMLLPLGDCTKARASALAQGLVTPDSTLWILVERNIVDDAGRFKASDARYYVCFEQLYEVHSWFHIFDEEKPAWHEQVTMPHRLTCAVLNVCRALTRAPREGLRVADPFVGTGTTLFECSKFTNVTADGNDLSDGFPLMIQDNARFFSDTQLRRTVLHEIKQWRSGLAQDDAAHDDVQLERLTDLITRCQDLTAIAAEPDFWQRLKLYLARRVLRRSSMALRRRAFDSQDVRAELPGRFARECRNLIQHIERVTRTEGWKDVAHGHLRLMKAPGQFSQLLGIGPAAAAAVHDDWADKELTPCDSLTWLADASAAGRHWNIVLMDPPYGVNQQENVGSDSVGADPLAHLYEAMIPRLVEVIAAGGVLAIVVPVESFNGQTHPPYVAPRMVTLRVQTAAINAGRRASPVSSAMPALRGLGPQLYWESQRVLRREALIWSLD